MLESRGRWGEWFPTDKKECPDGFYISGFRVRFQERQYFRDDTALNGLKLRCKNPYDGKTEDITIYEGEWGRWEDWVESEHNYLCGFQTRFEKCERLCDETGLNGIRFFMCPEP